MDWLEISRIFSVTRPASYPAGLDDGRHRACNIPKLNPNHQRAGRKARRSKIG